MGPRNRWSPEIGEEFSIKVVQSSLKFDTDVLSGSSKIYMYSPSMWTSLNSSLRVDGTIYFKDPLLCSK